MSLISLRSSVTCTPLGLHYLDCMAVKMIIYIYINLHIDPHGGGRMIRTESSFNFQSAISPTHGHEAASGPSHEHSLRSPRHCRLEFHPKMQDPLGMQTKPWQLCDFQEAQNIRMLRPTSIQAFVQLFPSWSRNMMKCQKMSRSILSIKFCLYLLSSANANLAPTTRRGKMLQNQSGSLQEEQTLPMLPALSLVPCGTRA